jgi:hypothetical protein
MEIRKCHETRDSSYNDTSYRPVHFCNLLQERSSLNGSMGVEAAESLLPGPCRWLVAGEMTGQAEGT